MKLPMVESAEESTWLFHEIGRCHLELGNFEEAEEYGEKSLGSAEQAQDTQWQLNATVLKAQSQGTVIVFTSTTLYIVALLTQ